MEHDMKYWADKANAEERYRNPNNPYDAEYPFLRALNHMRNL